MRQGSLLVSVQGTIKDLYNRIMPAVARLKNHLAWPREIRSERQVFVCPNVRLKRCGVSNTLGRSRHVGRRSKPQGDEKICFASLSFSKAISDTCCRRAPMRSHCVTRSIRSAKSSDKNSCYSRRESLRGQEEITGAMGREMISQTFSP